MNKMILSLFALLCPAFLPINAAQDWSDIESGALMQWSHRRTKEEAARIAAESRIIDGEYGKPAAETFLAPVEVEVPTIRRRHSPEIATKSQYYAAQPKPIVMSREELSQKEFILNLTPVRALKLTAKMARRVATISTVAISTVGASAAIRCMMEWDCPSSFDKHWESIRPSIGEGNYWGRPYWDGWHQARDHEIATVIAIGATATTAYLALPYIKRKIAEKRRVLAEQKEKSWNPAEA